jgi:hypothetical protein
MFKGEADAAAKAEKIGEWLGSHGEFKTHSRPLARDVLEAQGLKIDKLEANQQEQDAFLSVFHTFMHTINGTGAVKIIENQLGKAYLKQVRSVQMPVMMPMQLPLQLPGPGQPPPGLGGNESPVPPPTDLGKKARSAGKKSGESKKKKK